MQELSSRSLKTLTGEEESSLRWPVLAGKDFHIVAVDLRGKRVLLTTPESPLPAPLIERPASEPLANPVEVPAPFTADDPQLPLVPAF
jgi:hypothetical protein